MCVVCASLVCMCISRNTFHHLSSKPHRKAVNKLWKENRLDEATKEAHILSTQVFEQV